MSERQVVPSGNYACQWKYGDQMVPGELGLEAATPPVAEVFNAPGEAVQTASLLVRILDRVEDRLLAAALAGISMRLVTAALAGRGTPSRHDMVRLADLPSFRAVFVTNSLGVAAVSQVDDYVLPADPGFIRTLAEAYEAVPWDRI